MWYTTAMTRRTVLFATTALLTALPLLLGACAETPKADDAAAAPASTEEPIKLKLGGYYRSYHTVTD